MRDFLLLAALLLALAAVVRRLHPPAALADSLNWWVVYVALPALVLGAAPTVRIDWHLWFLIISQWGTLALSFVLFRWLGARCHWSRARIGALTLICGLSNTGFIGFPLVQALRGDEGLALAVIADQLGGFIGLAVGGPIIIAIYAGDRARPADIARRALRFPGFLALIAGLLAGQLGGLPAPVDTLAHNLSQTLGPLALFSVGLRLQLRLPAGTRAAIGLGLGWKLLLAPLVILLAGRLAGIGGLTLDVATLETAMAPMFTAVILARQHRFDTEIVDPALSYGLLLSFLTVPLWSLLLQ